MSSEIFPGEFIGFVFCNLLNKFLPRPLNKFLFAFRLFAGAWTASFGSCLVQGSTPLKDSLQGLLQRKTPREQKLNDFLPNPPPPTPPPPPLSLAPLAGAWTASFSSCSTTSRSSRCVLFLTKIKPAQSESETREKAFSGKNQSVAGIGASHSRGPRHRGSIRRQRAGQLSFLYPLHSSMPLPPVFPHPLLCCIFLPHCSSHPPGEQKIGRRTPVRHAPERRGAARSRTSGGG